MSQDDPQGDWVLPEHEDFLRERCPICGNPPNSDLSKFIGRHCQRVFDGIDIDFTYYKKSKNQLRILDSKNYNEKLTDSQQRVFSVLSNMINFCKKAGFLSGGSGIFIIRGEYPYKGGVSIERVGNGQRHMDQRMFLEWLENEEDEKKGGGFKSVVEALSEMAI